MHGMAAALTSEVKRLEEEKLVWENERLKASTKLSNQMREIEQTVTQHQDLAA